MKKLTKSAICAVVILAALLLVLVCCGEEEKVLEWPDRGLALLLPEPKTENGEVNYANDHNFSADIENVSLNDYEAYIEQCISNGFVIDAVETESRYEAYNQEGYKLTLYYNEYSEKYSIYLEAPKANGELSWPTMGLAVLIPIPDSDIGVIETDSAATFSVYVGEMDMVAYQSYVDACIREGFSLDYNKGEKSFSAKNENGVSLRVEYEGFDTIYVYLHMNETKDETTVKQETIETAETTETIETTEIADTTESSLALDIIRPEFKEMLDSYEAFFDEYIEFMELYEQNPGDLTLLTKYMEYMTQYADVMEKLSAVEDEEMSDAELLYYIEVNNRITRKLAEASQ